MTSGAADRGCRIFPIPEMHAGLVFELDVHTEIGKERDTARDHSVFRLPACIGIEIENIVILDAMRNVAMGQHVPDRLEQTARHEPTIIKPERWKAREGCAA